MAVWNLRIGNVYGPGGEGLPGAVARAIEEGGALQWALPHLADRFVDLIHVDDVVAAILKTLSQKGPGDTLLITGGAPVTLGELTNQLSRPGKPRPFVSPAWAPVVLWARDLALGLSRRADWITYLSIGSAPRVHRSFSPSKARQTLGFEPRVTLEEGLKKLRS